MQNIEQRREKVKVVLDEKLQSVCLVFCVAASHLKDTFYNLPAVQTAQYESLIIGEIIQI